MRIIGCNMKKVEISAARYKSLLAAEAYCQASRICIANNGNTNNAFPHLNRWMRYTGKKIKYANPTNLYPVWCSSCKKRHIYGKCMNNEAF